MADISALEANRVPDAEGIYLVGGLSRRVNVASQQSRGLATVISLKDRLIESGDQNGLESKYIAVIGGGACGLTVAAAAGYLKARVYIFESKERLGGAFIDSEHRYIHPNFNEWPFEEECPATNFPFLNWIAHDGACVNKQILNDWDLVVSETEARIRKPFTGYTITGINETKGGWQLTSEDKPFSNIPDFDYVFLCIGFGEDSNHSDLEKNPAYWSTENHRKHYNLSVRNFKEQKLEKSSRLLVIGNGDGGINECMQFIYKDYNPGDPQQRLLCFLKESGLNEQIKKIESDANSIISNSMTKTVSERRRILDNLGDDVWWKYVQLFDTVKELPAYQACFGDENIHPIRSVALVGMTKSPFDINATAINRFMLCAGILSETIEYHKNENRGKTNSTSALKIKSSNSKWLTKGRLKSHELDLGNIDYTTYRVGPRNPYDKIKINNRPIKTDEIRKNQVRMMEHTLVKDRSELEEYFYSARSEFRNSRVFKYYLESFSELLTDRFKKGFNTITLSVEKSTNDDEEVYKLEFELADSVRSRDRSHWEKILPSTLLGRNVIHGELDEAETVD